MLWQQLNKQKVKAMKTNTTKQKRTLKNINFEKEDSHIALVGPAVGGPANGQDYALVMKAVNFSEEAIQKMQAIKVTMTVPDFLRKFFGLYYEDAEVLARVMGYVPPENEENEMDSYEDWIDSKVQSIEIIKSMKDVNDPNVVLSSLDEHQYLAFLQDQEMLEKAFTAKESKPVATEAKATDTSIASEVIEKEVSASATQQLEKKTMTTTVETVEKSQFEALQKQLKDQAEALEKAQGLVAQFEREKKEAIAKARKEKLGGIIADESKADVLFKAVGSLEKDEDFDAVLTVLKSMVDAVKKSEMFEEKGAAAGSEGSTKESAVAKAVKQLVDKK